MTRIALIFILGCGILGAAAAEAEAFDAVVSLERTMCFGTCPVYKVEMAADGAVVFDGRKFVKLTGRAEGKTEPAEVQALLALARQIDFFALDERYDQRQANCEKYVTDMPYAIVMIKDGARTKTVRHYHGCRQTDALKKLAELEKRIDQTAGTERWIR